MNWKMCAAALRLAAARRAMGPGPAHPIPRSPVWLLSGSGMDPDESDEYFMTVSGFPHAHGPVTGGQWPGRPRETQEPSGILQDGRSGSRAAGSGFQGRYHAFPISRWGRKKLTMERENPTLLYGYGGFEVSMQPTYSAGVGAAWLEQGGVYVLANIRGGGEFGPALAPGRPQGKPPARLRRFHRGGGGFGRRGRLPRRGIWASRADPTAACSWA